MDPPLVSGQLGIYTIDKEIAKELGYKATLKKFVKDTGRQ